MDLENCFYNLEGVHLNERKNNFNKLLQLTTPEFLQHNLHSIKPRNFLEQIFYVDFLIRARHTDKFFEILKNGNGIFVSKILKQKWFFQDVIGNFSEEWIVNEFLPSLSYPVKMKVLKKLALTLKENQLDQIFDYLLEKYGLSVAKVILFGCSFQKITDTFRNNELILTVEQLKRLLERDPNLVKNYLDEYQKNTKTKFNNNNFLKYIVWKHPNLYFEFKPFFNTNITLGRQTTKRILEIDQEKALEDLNKNIRLNIPIVTRKIKNFDTNILSKFFPAKKEKIGSYPDYIDVNLYLKSYPYKLRWNVLVKAFERTYNDKILNNIDHLEYFESIFPKDVSQQFAKKQYEKTRNINYIYKYDFVEAFSIVKERINLTSNIAVRIDILKYLVIMCYSNKDYEAYEQVLQYIALRHRNDNLLEIMIIIKERIDYDLSTEQFWKTLNNLIDFYRIKYSNDINISHFPQYLVFCIKKNLPVENALAQYIKDAAKDIDWSLNNFRDPEIKASIIALLIAEPIECNMSLFKTIVKFNVENRNYWINLNKSPVIVDFIKNTLTRKQFDINDIIVLKYLLQYNYTQSLPENFLKAYEDQELLDAIKRVYTEKPNDANRLNDELFKAIKKPRNTDFQIWLLDYYFKEYFSKCSPQFSKEPVLNYFTKHEPDILRQYFKEILDVETCGPYINYSTIKLYSHLNLDKELVAHVKPLISVTPQFLMKLSQLVSTEEYLLLISSYIPKQFKLEDMSDEEKKFYEIQRMAIKGLNNLEDSFKLIPLVSVFCQGDYLQLSIPLLYRVLYRINEEQVLKVIKELGNKAVSLRKQTIHLGFKLLPQDLAVNHFKKLSSKEMNVSLKKFYLTGIFKYYLQNPSDHLMNQVLQSLVFIDKGDDESLNMLVTYMEKVPVKQRRIFAESIWKSLTTIEEQQVNVQSYQNKLLNVLNSFDNEFFEQLSTDILKTIVDKHFLSDDNQSHAVYTFITKFLASQDSLNHFDIVFTKIKNSKNHTDIFQFFNCALMTCFSNSTSAFVKKLQTYWQQVFNVHQSFSEHLLLEFLCCYKRTSNITEFCKEIHEKLQEIHVEFGSFILKLLSESLCEFLDKLKNVHQDWNLSEIAYELLRINVTELNCFIVYEIMIRWPDQDEEEKLFKNKILELLKSIDSGTVSIFYNKLLRI
ncbi:hypothetical protein ABEB36_003244 [Hypothenemus hampei]|uniref:Uncharacterized protein n=1 Tax=Hypothenemus hampei TaxID=57062 RepID=A0ABD1FB63_HYPHA